MECCKITNRYLISEYPFRLCILSIVKVTEVKHFSDKLLKRVFKKPKYKLQNYVPQNKS